LLIGTKIFTIMDANQRRRSRKHDKVGNSLAFGRHSAHDHEMADERILIGVMGALLV
jgi:hypothetical protein